MLAALLAGAALVAAPQDTTRLTLVVTTDVRGQVAAVDERTGRAHPGGLVRLGTLVDSLRRERTGRVLVLDVGDAHRGTPFAAYHDEQRTDPWPVTDALNLVGYDAATVGAHDLDAGLEPWRRAVGGAGFPVVSATVRVLPADTLLYPAFAVLRRAGVRVAVTGVTAPGAMVWAEPALRGEVRLLPVEAAAPALAAARRQADVVVALAHMGVGLPSSYDTTGVGPEHAAEVLASLPNAPDVIVAGHSGRRLADTTIGRSRVVQPRGQALEAAVVDLWLVRVGEGHRLVRSQAALVPLGGFAPSPRVTRQLADALEAARRWADEPVAEVDGVLDARLARAEATPLAQLVGVAMRRRTGAALAAVPARLAGQLGPRDARRGSVLGLVPAEDRLVAVRLSGAGLRAFLEHTARAYAVDSAGRVRLDPARPASEVDEIVGATYTLDLGLPPGFRVRDLAVNGRPVGDGDAVTVAMTDWRARGNGGYGMVRGLPRTWDRGEALRDVLLAEVSQRRRLVEAAPSAAWRLAPAGLAAQVRAAVGGEAVAGRATVGDSVLARLLVLAEPRGALEGSVLPDGRRAGGAAVLRAWIDSLAAACRCPTVRLAVGDLIHGDGATRVTAGLAGVDALNRLGLDVATPGPGDGGWGLDTLRQRQVESRFAWVAANAVPVDGRPAAWLRPWRLVRAGGLRIGVVGAMATPAAGDAPALRATDPAAVREAVAAVRAEGADLVVLLAATAPAEAVRLLAVVGEGAVDAVVRPARGGAVADVTRGLATVAPQADGVQVGVLDVVRTPVGERVLRVTLETTVAERVRPDAATAAALAPYGLAADSAARLAVARLRLPMPLRGPRPGPLGDLAADALHDGARADVGLVVLEGLAGTGLPAGTVSAGALQALLPVARPLVRVATAGAVLRALLEQALLGDAPALAVSGVEVVYDAGQPAGRRVREVLLPGRRRLDDRTPVTLAVTDALADGLGDLTALARLEAEATGLTDREALARYLRRLPQPVDPPETTRWRPVTR